MGISNHVGRYTRREALRMGGVAAGGLMVAGTPLLSRGTSNAPSTTPMHEPGGGALPIQQIQEIIQAEGTFDNGVLNIEIDREDLDHVVGPGNVPIKPSFEANGNVTMQALHDGTAMMNSDLCFKDDEINGAIDQMVSHDIVFQAFHQHVYSFENPDLWFMHFRGRGNPLDLARGVAAILSATSTPLPQTMPSNPQTPLDAERLSQIIGATPSVGADGVVTFELPQREPIRLGGVRINPYLNVFTPVAFEPLGGSTAVVVPDFGLLADEINPVMQLMRSQGWEIGCLYNQETDERPQLYFSHQIKTGDAYQLATEVRRGLELTSVAFTQ